MREGAENWNTTINIEGALSRRMRGIAPFVLRALYSYHDKPSTRFFVAINKYKKTEWIR
jgi:hypothetical protein